MSNAPDTPPRTLAERVDHLFRTVHPRGRGEHSFEEVATAIRERGGPTVSASYLWMLRKGLRDNPTKKHLEALSDYFGVPPAYFFDDEQARRIDAQLELLAAVRDSGVESLALRAAGLSPAGLGAAGDVIDVIRRAEGLQAAPGTSVDDAAPKASGAVPKEEN